MLHKALLNPSSIAIIGGSNDEQKPGGKLVYNIKASFKGKIFVVNPKEELVQDLPCFKNINDLPPVDLAILAIASKLCFDAINILGKEKGTRGFIIISAGFSETGTEGAAEEKRIATLVNHFGGTLIGPNCIGLLTSSYSGIFTSPVPLLNSKGIDFVSSSGATAVFIIESAIPKGLTFASVWSIGNAAQTNIEDVLEYFDETYIDGVSPRVKIIYIESIKNPDKLLNHATSLVHKGCRIAAIKAGGSEAGSRAALSHTGAIANSELAVEALFRKAGIVRCSGREELTTVASVLLHKELKGNRIAIITHAGGPAVMLTDALATSRLEVLPIDERTGQELLQKLPAGSSVKNPIDFLATGTADHLEQIIDTCEKLSMIDGMAVIFGSTGLHKIFDVYEVLHRKMETCQKPIFPILPSIQTAHAEVDQFLSKGHINFPDEVMLGQALGKVYNTPHPVINLSCPNTINIKEIRQHLDKVTPGFLTHPEIRQLLSYTSIKQVDEVACKTQEEVVDAANLYGYPVVLKVNGPIHKTDVGGVVLNIKSEQHLLSVYRQMMEIPGVLGVLVQPMVTGLELFIGANYEPAFGHVIFCGLGGIFVEALHDVSYGLAPLSYEEAYSMIRSLRSYPILKGMRGQQEIDEDVFAQIIVNLSWMLRNAVEIKEMDINPLIAKGKEIVAVDVRVLISDIFHQK